MEYTSDRQIEITKVPQTITLPPIADRVGDPTLTPILLGASSDSGLPITYMVDSGDAHLTADGTALIITGAGPITLSARQAGDAIFAPATTTITFQVTKRLQQIDFAVIPDQIFHSAPPKTNQVQLSATTSSGLPVMFTLDQGHGIIEGDVLTLTRQSRFKVKAGQPGNEFYEAAESVTRDFIARSDAPIVFKARYANYDAVPGVLAPRTRRKFTVEAFHSDLAPYGFHHDVELQLVSGPVYASSSYWNQTSGFILISIGTPMNNPSVVTPTGTIGAITFRAYHLVDSELFLEPSAMFTIHVGKTQSIRFEEPRPMPLAQGSLRVRPTASSGLRVTLAVVSGPATAVQGTDGSYQLTATDSGLVVLRASQAGADLFAPATPVLREWLVQGSEQTLSFDPPATATYGDAPIPLSAASNLATTQTPLPVTFSVLSGPGRIDTDGDKLLLVGAGPVVVRAAQAGGQGIGPAFATRTVNVRKATLRVRGEPGHLFVGDDISTGLIFTGFVGDDNYWSLDTPPRPRTPATRSSPPGTYPITFTGGRDDSYEFVAADPPGTLTLHSFGGVYEALVTSDSGDLLGRLSLTISAKSPTYSGTFTFAEFGTILPLKSFYAKALHPTTATYETVTGLLFPKSEDTTSRGPFLEFTLHADGRINGIIGHKNHSSNELHEYGNFTGRRLYAGKTAPWQGPYTATLSNRNAIDFAVQPLGVGWATAAITPAGRLTITGRLADDSVLTASLNGDELGTYRLLYHPYGQRIYSYLGGSFTLDALDTPAKTGGYHISAVNGATLTWRKTARPVTSSSPRAQDPLFPDGFGPMEVGLTLDPWLAPVSDGPAETRATLGQRLRLTTDRTSSATLQISLGDADFGAESADLPERTDLTPNNTFSLPTSSPVEWTLRAVNLKTGRFEGGFTLEDRIAAPTSANPTATRSHKRQVHFSGVLRQPKQAANAATSPLGAGYFILHPLPSTGTERAADTAKPESHPIMLRATTE